MVSSLLKFSNPVNFMGFPFKQMGNKAVDKLAGPTFLKEVNTGPTKNFWKSSIVVTLTLDAAKFDVCPLNVEILSVLEYRRSKMEEMGLTEDEFYAKQFEIQGEIPEPLKTSWTGPLVVRHVPPRDWPPRGWEVDREELEFIRGAHKLQAVRVDLDKVEEESSTDTEELCLERYKVFLKQYNEWVAANKDRLEKESYKV